VWPWTAGTLYRLLLAIREAAGGFAGAVGYLVKPPHHSYCLWCAHGRLHHRGEALALKYHHYLFAHLLPYDYPDFTLSVGRAWRCCARRGRLRTGLSVVPGGDRRGRAGRWLGEEAALVRGTALKAQWLWWCVARSGKAVFRPSCPPQAGKPNYIAGTDQADSVCST
jgi:hypothetical protein